MLIHLELFESMRKLHPPPDRADAFNKTVRPRKKGSNFSQVKAEIVRFYTPPRSCQYIPSEIACLDYRVLILVSPDEFDEMLSRGWRRMGFYFFRPACGACVKCRSLRLRVNDFSPNRSQRRIAKANHDLRLVIRPPTVTDEHLRLWREYHSFMSTHRGWPDSPIDAAQYTESFLSGNFPFSREFLYYSGDKLVAVGLVDITQHSLSSVYFYHDPLLRDRALGIYSILAELDVAKQQQLTCAYLGYWVEECQSMAYKAQFRPHELLAGFPDDSSPPEWH